MTFADLLDEGLPHTRNPVAAAFAYSRDALGTFRLVDVTAPLLAVHRDRLLGAPTGGHRYRTLKPRTSATARNYLVELGRLFAYVVKELHVMEDKPCAKVAKPAATPRRHAPAKQSSRSLPALS